MFDILFIFTLIFWFHFMLCIMFWFLLFPFFRILLSSVSCSDLFLSTLECSESFYLQFHVLIQFYPHQSVQNPFYFQYHVPIYFQPRFSVQFHIYPNFKVPVRVFLSLSNVLVQFYLLNFSCFYKTNWNDQCRRMNGGRKLILKAWILYRQCCPTDLMGQGDIFQII